MKLLRAIFWSMVAVFLGIWLFSTRACAQDVLPENPSVASTGTGHILMDSARYSGRQNSPGMETTTSSVDGAQQDAPRFFSFRKSWQDPPLRTTRQMFRSKLYIASQVGGAVAMIVACRNKRSGEDWHSEVPAVLGVDAMAYLGGRFFTQPFAVGPGVYEMMHYSQAATK